MTDELPASTLEALADTLWQERRMVELLLYRMTTAKLLLAADDHRFVAAAIDEVEVVLDALRAAEDGRLAALVDVARLAGVPVDELTLSEVVRRSPAPLRDVFTDHLQAFQSMTAEIEQVADTNRRLTSSALGRVRQSLDALAGPGDDTTYDRDGRSQPISLDLAPAHLDRAL
jgi:hypothetical protein